MQASVEITPCNIWGVDIGRRHSGVDGGAWAYDPPIKTVDDLDQLQIPQFRYNEEETQRRFERCSELLDGIMPVEISCGCPLNRLLGTAAAELRGLEQMMVDMVLEPELLHRLMAFLRDCRLAAIDFIEADGRLKPAPAGPMYMTDPIGAQSAAGAAPTLKNCLLATNSQEYDQVSPAMWEEFCLDYQKPIFQRYGLVSYGCCENLTHKVSGVLSIPNLRIFVCSAWSDLDTIVDAVGSDYTIMWRQKASDVVIPDDVGAIRRHLEAGCRRLQGCSYQIVLRELETLYGHPDRLHVWRRLAQEAAEKWA